MRRAAPARHGVAEHRAALLDRSIARYVLFLDDDVWLEPGTVRGCTRRSSSRCGLVGAAVQGVSYLQDRRPQAGPFERWVGRPEPERIAPGTPAWDRGTLHNAANPLHLAAAHLRPEQRRVAYKIAWVGGWCSTTGRSSTPSADSTSGSTSCPRTAERSVASAG